MKLIKYDRGNSSENTATNIGNSTEIDNNYYSYSPSNSRTIWGQNDTFDDVDGSMVINGNITIKSIVPPVYDQDDKDDDGEVIEEETGGGNLNVESKITSKEVEANNIYATEHLYIPHPDTKVKTDILDLLKDYNGRINTNATNITSLSTTVSNHTTNIANNSTNIKNNADEIEKLKKSIISEERIKELISNNTTSTNGSTTNPVILHAGKIFRATSSTYSTSSSIQIPKFILTANIKDGLMLLTITPNTGVKVNVYSVNITQYESDKTTDISKTSIQDRDTGAHWFEAHPDNMTDTKKIYIREFHQADGNNNSWDSTTWFSNYNSVSAINVMIIGYITED